MIPCEVPTAGTKSPMKRTTSKGCIRQCTQARAEVEAALVRRKKDYAVPNYTTLLP